MTPASASERAASIDPTSLSTANSNALTMFILGGLSQVQRAVQGLVRDDDDLGRDVIARSAQMGGYSQAIEDEIIQLKIDGAVT